jgi:iron complex outermembrane receptor protein
MPAAAQDTAAEQPEEVQGIAEIVITARRNQESLQEVPIAVTALTGETLAQRSIDSTADIDLFTPNLVEGSGVQGGSVSQYAIRGMGQSDFIATIDPAVGVYLDGVYLGRVIGAALDLLDVERVEVLRGPQGTLFGRNTIGGAINVVSKDPTNEFGGSVRAILGSRDRIDASLSLNVPLVDDKVLFNLGVMTKNQDGFVRSNIDPDFVWGDRERLAARGSLLLKPSDSLRIKIAADWTRERGTPDPVRLIGADPAFGGDPTFISNDPFRTNSGFFVPNNLDVFGIGANLEWEITPNVTFRSISSYRDLDLDVGTDFGGSPIAFLDQSNPTKQNQFSQEFHLTGKSFNAQLEWLLGLYYFDENVDQVVTLNVGVPLVQGNFLDNKSYSGFLHANYKLTDKLSLSGGVRFTKDKKKHFFDHTIAGFPLFPPTTLQRSFTPVTWRAALDYKFSEGVLAYASASKGFRTGGFVGRPNGIGELRSFRPETVVAYEVGLKSDLLDRNLRLNLAAFYNDYSDIQITTFDIGPGGGLIISTDNAGIAEVYGFEAEVLAIPTDGLTLNAGIGFLENKYKKITNPSTRLTLDNELPFAPKWTVSLGAEYRADLGDAGDLTGRIDYAYKSSFFFFAQNNPLDLQEPYDLVNLRLTYTSENERWHVAAFGINVFDKVYSRFREDIRFPFGVALDWPAPGAEWGIEVGFKF